jgi:hypothetical protein
MSLEQDYARLRYEVESAIRLLIPLGKEIVPSVMAIRMIQRNLTNALTASSSAEPSAEESEAAYRPPPKADPELEDRLAGYPEPPAAWTGTRESWRAKTRSERRRLTAQLGASGPSPESPGASGCTSGE